MGRTAALLTALLFLGSCRLMTGMNSSTPQSSDEWTGSPYMQWRLPFMKEGSVAWLHRTRNGVLVFLKRRGRLEKLAYVTEQAGVTQWIISYVPRRSHPYMSPSFTIWKDSLILTGQGDVMRDIDMTTGHDRWNRGGCTSVAISPEGRLWAICLGTLKLLSPDTGAVLREIEGEHASMVLAVRGAPVILTSGGIVKNISSGTRTVLHTEDPEAITTDEYIAVWHHTGWRGVELLSSEGRLKWSKNMEYIPPRPWHATVGDTVIVPVSPECISGFALSDGKLQWNSCGLDTTQPPAVVPDGLFMLSSHVEAGDENKGLERAIIFVDGFNGLQTILFNHDEETGRVVLTARFIAGGINHSRYIFAVDSADSLMSIRIAK